MVYGMLPKCMDIPTCLKHQKAENKIEVLQNLKKMFVQGILYGELKD